MDWHLASGLSIKTIRTQTFKEYLLALTLASLLEAQGVVGEPDTEMTRDTREEDRAERER